jgi:alkanesulfonate monooxygenase SsuD/methylene tetrahydromethanopterin reductase-like flavin-dependent oxidoreductase (luciferase family)/iron-sulfur cluster repair protein YtfE (RIC family)
VTDYGQELRFGVFITPSAAQAHEVVALAQLADAAALDFVTFQDHPYQPRHLDALTLLSVVAAQTTTVRVALNVANLPLRPPAMLARAIATLDLLSEGRVELGLGAGAFWDGIVAAGGPRRTPGESVTALGEAIAIIRDVWDPELRTVRRRGEHYEVHGMRTGPAPAHPVEIWLGAYKPRMLRLTGASADGWLPSMGYADPDALPAMSAAIDAAAQDAGRNPAAVRRLYNINGTFGSGRGLLAGAPSEWACRLAELTLQTGMSSYIPSVSSAEDLRRFAEEVAPAVRELVEQGRERPAPPSTPVRAGATAWSVVPTPDDGRRLSGEAAWDEATRPTGPAADPHAVYAPQQQAAGQHLIDVHDALRAELGQLRDLIAQVEAGQGDASTVRRHINRMTIRQNNWTLGTFCAAYCRALEGHHSLEDRGIFPHLRRADPRLEPVLDRLHAEHEVIADLVDRIDRAFVELVGDEPDGMREVRAVTDLLTDALLSHLSYEERELVEPLGRHGYTDGARP